MDAALEIIWIKTRKTGDEHKYCTQLYVKYGDNNKIEKKVRENGSDWCVEWLLNSGVIHVTKHYNNLDIFRLVSQIYTNFPFNLLKI